MDLELIPLCCSFLGSSIRKLQRQLYASLIMQLLAALTEPWLLVFHPLAINFCALASKVLDVKSTEAIKMFCFIFLVLTSV